VRRIFAGAGVTIALTLTAATARAADRQIRPFIGVTFAGDTSIVDNEHAAGHAHTTLGISAARLGDIFGFDVEVARTPGFFQAGDVHLVQNSHVTTAVGDVVIAAPRRMSEYSLRLYFVGGGGIMRVVKSDLFQVFDIADVLPAFDLGAGAFGFLTNEVGVSWEFRRFQSLGGTRELTGLSFERERLTFWRATMALVVRY
jgi:hypothetical protein